MKAMVKSALLIGIMAITTTVNSQTLGISKESNDLTYEEVIKVDSLKADEIYVLAKEWALLTLKATKKGLFIDNKPTLMKVQYHDQYLNRLGNDFDPYVSTFTIRIKDGSVKILVDEMLPTDGLTPAEYLYKKNGKLRTDNNNEKIYNSIKEKIERLTRSLKDFLINKGGW